MIGVEVWKEDEEVELMSTNDPVEAKGKQVGQELDRKQRSQCTCKCGK